MPARIDGRDEVATLQDGLDALVKQVNQSWPGNPVPQLRMLPTDLDHAALRRSDPDTPPILLGIDEADLRPVRLDLLGADQHLVVFGDTESGKTTLARLIIRELIDHHTDDHVAFAVFDLRRTLLDVVPEPYCGAYAGTAPMAAGMAGGIANELANRLPPDDVTTTQLLRARHKPTRLQLAHLPPG